MTTLASTLFAPRTGFDSQALAVELPASSGTPAQFTFAQLERMVKHVQGQLAALNFASGTTVSISLINNAEFVAVFLATAEQGLVAAPLNPNYKESEVSFYLDDTKSQLLVVPSGTLRNPASASEGALAAVAAAKALNVRIVEAVLDAQQAKIWLQDADGPLSIAETSTAWPDHTALVLHTSGTTGRPKAVPLTHTNLVTSMHNIRGTYDLSAQDKTYLVMPLFHVHGLVCGLLSALFGGGSVVIPPRFSAKVFWEELVNAQANWYTAVPTIHQIILGLDKPNPMPKLRFVRSCSSSLSPSTFTALEEALQVPVLEAYAMTEAAHQMCSNCLPPGKRKPGTVGIGHGVEVRILDGQGKEVPQGQDGEVCVRGKNVTPGYLNNDKANRDSFFRAEYGNPADVDGFLRTGDQGRKDEDGYLVLTGRIKELINRSGEKISPLEIDSALLAVPGIKEAVSFGMPDEIYGELVGAAVVLDSHAQLDQAAIQEALSSKLIKFKIPNKIFITDSIPKTATGKIQRRNVAATFFMANARLNRVMREIAACERDKSDGIAVQMVDDGLFKVDIVVPEGYPFQPLKMRFISKVYHPNVSSQSGAICLDILKDQWTPIYTLKSTLMSLRSLLCSPEPNDPQDAEVARHYTSDFASYEQTAREWTHKYAAPDPPQTTAKEQGLRDADVARFVNMGFERNKVIEVLDRLDYRNDRVRQISDDTVTEALLK
ncbi:oxalate--CoA ligase [Malassezia brasiliensis]|uniref:Oxalate--CoA ligase n=1 Tax=Malassezia brasiliensis TaxID=1821822 RepID=A0AAF0DQ83_9BASI|nr:oxalate--CoA ligase [Malassezia brasiliensis]